MLCYVAKFRTIYNILSSIQILEQLTIKIRTIKIMCNE